MFVRLSPCFRGDRQTIPVFLFVVVPVVRTVLCKGRITTNTFGLLLQG